MAFILIMFLVSYIISVASTLTAQRLRVSILEQKRCFRSDYPLSLSECLRIVQITVLLPGDKKTDMCLAERWRVKANN